MRVCRGVNAGASGQGRLTARGPAPGGWATFCSVRVLSGPAVRALPYEQESHHL